MISQRRPRARSSAGLSLLQPGEEDVLLVAHVLAQHLDQAPQPGRALGVVEAVALEGGDELVDLLVLLLDLQGQRIPVRDDAPDDRPAVRLLRRWRG